MQLMLDVDVLQTALMWTAAALHGPLGRSCLLAEWDLVIRFSTADSSLYHSNDRQWSPSSIAFSIALVLTEVMGELEPRRVDFGKEADYTLNWLPLNPGAFIWFTTAHTHIHVDRQLVNIMCMFLESGRKLEYPRENTSKLGEYMQTPHRKTEAEIQTQTSELWGRCANSNPLNKPHNYYCYQ